MCSSDLTPERLFEKILHGVNTSESSLVVVDEFDKWFSYITQFSTKEQKGCQTSSEDQTRKMRKALAVRMLSIIENNDLRNSCVLAFCCNSFPKMFSEVDEYEVLRDRLLTVKFQTCRKAEIISFYKQCNIKLLLDKSTIRFHCSDFDEIMDKLNPDVEDSFRKLIDLFLRNDRNFRKIVEELNK